MVSRYPNCSPMTETVRVILKIREQWETIIRPRGLGESAVCYGLTLKLLANHNFDYIKTIWKKKNDRDLLKLEPIIDIKRPSFEN